MFEAPKPIPLPPSSQDHRVAIRFRRYGLWLAWLSIAAGSVTLILGWAFGIPLFVRIVDGYPAMVPETAMAVLFGGCGVVLSYAYGLCWAKVICGLLILALVSVENLLRPFEPVDFRQDRMSIATSLANVLLAATLLTRSLPDSRSGLWAVSFATLGLSVVAIPVLGFIFNAQALLANALYSDMSLQTAVSLFALFMSLLMIEPKVGWIGVLAAPERGSEMARKILPVIVLGPVVLCGLALFAARHEILTPDLRAAVLTFAMIFTTVAAALHFADLINMSERRAHLANAMLRDSERARQETELAVVRAQKVEALGNLVGGVAHDFNNTLTVILGNLELMQEDADNGRQTPYVKEAITASRQAAELTRQLLAYGRTSRPEPSLCDLGGVIQAALTMFGRICPANISLLTDLASDHAVVEVDAANMQQALLNILINARDAQPDGGEILVSTEISRYSRATVQGFSDNETLPDGTYVTVSVRDRGPGISPEILARATEPYFTTKQVGAGSGLGLSVVSGFCRQSGGGLMLASEPGQGARVSMVFPLQRGTVVKPTGAPESARADDITRRDILIVDDEVQVTRVLARQLLLDGHRVRVAPNAEQALAMLAAEPLPDLVLSDLVMPGNVQGDALARIIADRHPSVRVIVMSGYESARRRGQMDATGDMPFLQKPIDRTQLRAAVSAAFSR